MNYTQFDIRESSAQQHRSNTWLNSRIKGFFFWFFFYRRNTAALSTVTTADQSAHRIFFSLTSWRLVSLLGNMEIFSFFFFHHFRLSNTFVEKKNYAELRGIQEAPLESLLVGKQIEIVGSIIRYHSFQNRSNRATRCVRQGGRKTNQCITTHYGEINMRWEAVKCQRTPPQQAGRRHRMNSPRNWGGGGCRLWSSASSVEEQRWHAISAVI